MRLKDDERSYLRALLDGKSPREMRRADAMHRKFFCMGVVYAESNQLTRKGETFAVRHAAARESIVDATPALSPAAYRPPIDDFVDESLDDNL
jgi:hypothetical protein